MPRVSRSLGENFPLLPAIMAFWDTYAIAVANHSVAGTSENVTCGAAGASSRQVVAIVIFSPGIVKE